MKQNNSQSENQKNEVPEKKESISEKRLVICLKCGHEFKTKAISPRCSKCRSQKVKIKRTSGKMGFKWIPATIILVQF